MYTFVERHRDDLALKIAAEDAPCALVDDKRRLASHPSVRVRLGDDPGRGI